MAITGNLPINQSTGPVSTKVFFDNFFHGSVSFPAAEIDATVAFFQKRGFDLSSASSTAIILLNQAKLVSIPTKSPTSALSSTSFKTNPNKVDTYCNLFVADVSWAMGMPVPWSVIDRAGSKNDSPFGPEWKYISLINLFIGYSMNDIS